MKCTARSSKERRSAHTCISFAAGELSPSRSMALSVILVSDAESADPRKISPPIKSWRKRASLLKVEALTPVDPPDKKKIEKNEKRRRT